MTTPPQYSPDGKWWWDGTQWVPAPTPSYGSQGYGAGQPYGPPYQPSGSSDGKGIASLIIGVLWIGGLGSIAAVVLGHMSRSEARKAGREPSGISLAGLIVGYAGLALGVIGLVLLLVVGFTFKDQIVSAVEVNIELDSASHAEQSYHDAKGTYTSSLEDLRNYGYHSGKHVDVTVVSATDTAYCLKTTVFSQPVYESNTSHGTTNVPCF